MANTSNAVDYARAEELIEKLEFVFESAPEREKMSEELIKIAKAANNKEMLAAGYYNLAIYYNSIQCKYPLFVSTMNKFLEYAKDTELNAKITIAYILLGVDAINYGQYNLNMNYFMLARHFAEASDEPAIQALVYYHMCGFFIMVGDIETATEYGEMSVELLNELEDVPLVFGSDAMDFCNCMLGQCYMIQGDLVKTKRFYDISMEREKKYTPRFDCPNTALIYTFHIEALHSMGETAERDRQCDEFISLFDKHSPSPPFFFHILNLVKFFLDNKLYSHAKRFLPYLYCANRFINNNNFGQLISLSSIAIARAEGDTEAYHKFLEEYMNYSVLNYGYVLNNLKLSANLLVEMDEIKEKMQQQQNEIEVAKASSDAKSKFLSNVSHEIRTPLNAILGMDEIILRETKSKDIYKYATDIKNAGDTLLGLINDILDSSKLDVGKLEIIPVEYDISSVINDLLNMVKQRAENKGLEFIVKVDKDIPYLLYGDEIRIKQCVLNILTNAVKYTESGSVTLEVTSRAAGQEEMDKARQHIYKKEDGSEICFGDKCQCFLPRVIRFRVVDTGIGIKEEDLEKLYKPFERIEEKRNRNIEGTGLGMNIVQKLLKLMDTHLDVKSVYGEGSDFSFEIIQGVMTYEVIGDYAERYETSVANMERYNVSFTAPDAKILVVDDTPANLTVIKGLLKPTKVQVDTATSGKETLVMVRKKAYDIMFIDHRMPEMDGIETLRALEEMPDNLSKNAVCIALTANAISGAREMFLQEGFDDYLSKPVDSKKLERMVLTCLPEELVVEEDSEEEKNIFTEDEPESGSLMAFLAGLDFIDEEKALENSGGNEEILASTIEDFVKSAKKEPERIVKFLDEGDLKNYTILVHGLKSSSRLVGAMNLSSDAAYLENCGDEENSDEIRAKTPKLLTDYKNIAKTLSKFFEKEEEDDKEKPPIEKEALDEIYSGIFEFVSAYDFSSAEDILKMTERFSLEKEDKEKISLIYDYLRDVNHDAIIEILGNVTK